MHKFSQTLLYNKKKNLPQLFLIVLKTITYTHGKKHFVLVILTCTVVLIKRK